MNKIRNFLLCLLFFALFFANWDPLQTNGAFSIVKAAGIIYFISIIPKLKNYLRIYPIRKEMSTFLIFFLFLIILNIFNFNVISETDIVNPTMLQWSIMMMIIVNHVKETPQLIDKLMLYFTLGAVLGSVFFLLKMGIEFTTGNEERVLFFNENANSVALKSAIAIVYIIYTVFFNRFKYGISRFLLLLSLPTIFNLFLNTGSRGGLFILVTMLLFLVLFIKIKLWKRIMLIPILVIASIFLVDAISKSEVMSGRLNRTIEEHSIGGREVIWNTYIPYIYESPIWGYGETGFNSIAEMVEGASPHNVFIELLLISGIIGFSIFMRFFYLIYKQGYLTYKHRNYLFPMLLFFPMFGSMLFGQLLATKLFYLLTAYILSAKYIDRNENFMRH
ncbi:MAG: O-antigen ligase family protein [Tannerella sp.]|jgi:O-antigen ligase|nr:O-antigen ligase family protein [Tannerella sp.]